MNLVVLDLDGSVTSQPVFADAIGRGTSRLIDLRPIAPHLSIVASHEARHDLLLLTEPLFEAGPPPVVFYGSGDFHHVTASLIAHVSEPVTVIHFDNHPDWVTWPRAHTCGSWVCRALELPQVRRVITLGPASRDLVRPELRRAALSTIESGRLEVYPWRHPPSRVYRWHRDTKCTSYDGRHLHWRELAIEDWATFLHEMTALLPTEAVYITIDKGVLPASHAATNRDQGAMPLGHLITALEVITARCTIAGIDVCGEYGTPVYSDMFRRTLARLDHPLTPAPGPAGLAVNATTNERLLACLETALAR